MRMSILVSGDDLIILIVGLRSFQLKISFSIILNFSRFFEIFWDLLEKALNSESIGATTDSEIFN